MTLLRSLSIAALAIVSNACSDDATEVVDDTDTSGLDASADAGGLEKVALDLTDVAAHPDDYAWFDTDVDDFTTEHEFEEQGEGVQVFAPPLDSQGGMTAAFIETTANAW